MKLTIKNVAAFPYGARTSSGVKIVEPGETLSDDFDDGEAKNIKANSSVFAEVKAETKKAEKPDDKADKD